MRWKTPSERTQMILLSPILLPVGLAGFAMFIVAAPIVWPLIRYFRWDESRGWRRWFAWRPVFVSGFFSDEPSRWVWLETIERHGFEHRPTRYRWPTPANMADEVQP